MRKKTHLFCVYGRFRELLPTVLGFRGDLQGQWHLVHVWVAWPKTHRFCILGPFSWAIAHSFGVLGWFTRPMTLSICLSDMTKNSSFCVNGRFPELFPIILGFWGGLQGPWHLVHVWVAWPKIHSFLRFRTIFTNYFPQFWGSDLIYKDHNT
jgi:hypothetical protein